METVVRIKVSELDLDFVNAIKSLFKKEREIEITVSSSTDFDLNKEETKEEYFERLRRAIKNIDNGVNVVSFNENELEEFSNNLINEK